MRILSVAIALVGFACAALVFWQRGLPPAPQAVEPEAPPSEAARHGPRPMAEPGAAPPAAATAQPVQASATAPPPRDVRIPPEFAGFETWPFERQLDSVTDVQRNAHLSQALRDFLVELASDPTRRAVLRNNAANALGVQDPPVPGWLGRLADQALDPTESPTWRDYALQHLSDQLVPRDGGTPADGDFVGSPESGLDRRRYIAVLTTVAASGQTVAGTALLHLDRLSREHGVVIDQARFHDLLLRVLEDASVDIGAKVTAFGILGMRKNPADADVPRRYLHDPRVDVRRAAVAALGSLGTIEDIAAIEAVEAGGDRSVEMAKAAACKRISMRQRE